MSRAHVRQVLGRHGASVEDHANPYAKTAIDPGEIGPVAHEAAGFDVLAPRIAHGDLVLVGELDDLAAVAVEERVATDEERIGLVAGGGRKGGLQLGNSAGRQG